MRLLCPVCNSADIEELSDDKYGCHNCGDIFREIDAETIDEDDEPFDPGEEI